MSEATTRTAFLTGATGMIGSHMARRLLDEGWHVRALVRPSSDTGLLASWGVELVEGDVTNPAGTLTEYIEDAEVTYHFAALVSDWASLEDMVNVNVEGTRHLAKAVLAAGAGRLVYLSSMVVYGMGPQRDVDETAPLVRTGDNYNLTKIRAEEVVAELGKQRGLPAVIVRAPYVYGQRDRQFLPRVFENLQKGTFKFIGSGLQPLTLAYVKNLVEGLYLAGTKPGVEGEIFNITDGESITRVRLMDVLCEEAGYPMPEKHVPTFVARLACPIVEAVHCLSRSTEPPLINKFKLKFMASPLTYSIEKARCRLGYEPKVPTEAGLRKTVAWMREHREDLMPTEATFGQAS